MGLSTSLGRGYCSIPSSSLFQRQKGHQVLLYSVTEHNCLMLGHDRNWETSRLLGTLYDVVLTLAVSEYMPWIPYVPLMNRDQMELGDPEKKKKKEKKNKVRHQSSHQIGHRKFLPSRWANWKRKDRRRDKMRWSWIHSIYPLDLSIGIPGQPISNGYWELQPASEKKMDYSRYIFCLFWKRNHSGKKVIEKNIIE